MSRIYLVDDHAIVRDGLRAMLESGGHQVVGEAVDAAAALADEAAIVGADVVLLDLKLGGRSGLDLLGEWRRRGLAPRVLVLTMSDAPFDVSAAMRFGARGYLLKDSPGDELLRAIGAVMRGEIYVGARLHAQAGDLPPKLTEAHRLSALSPRERQIILMVVNGQSSASIGEQLGLSPKTIDTYRSRLMTKLEVADVTALVRFAVRVGLIDAKQS